MRSRPAADDDSDQDDLADEEAERGAECLGVDMEALEAALLSAPDAEQPEQAANPDEDVCYVLTENWTAFLLYQRCKSQFGLDLGFSGGRWSGCGAGAVRQELDWLGVKPKKQPKVVEQYRVIETEVLRLMNLRLNEKR